ncbi:hypothetical protein [Streptomyces sp. x-19]|uniref:hypothetical protein n=1 Tax=Streptomyces sp. x-19 TaxID=2789280 RepID=UPI003980F0F0
MADHHTIDGDVYVSPRYLAPVVRYTEHLHRSLAQRAHLTPIQPPKPPAPTPLDVQRAARRLPPAPRTRSVPRWSTTTRWHGYGRRRGRPNLSPPPRSFRPSAT